MEFIKYLKLFTLLVFLISNRKAFQGFGATNCQGKGGQLEIEGMGEEGVEGWIEEI